MPEPDAHDSEESPKQQAAPLQLVGLGLVIVFLKSLVGPEAQDGVGYDIFANPVGWLLVLLGTSRLPVGERGVLVGLNLLALAASVPLWFPAVQELLAADASLGWAAQLPEFAYVVLLCRALMASAKPTHPPGYIRFATLSVLFVLALLVPPVATAADSAWIGNAGLLVLVIAQVWLVWSLFSHSRRPYADAPPAAAADA